MNVCWSLKSLPRLPHSYFPAIVQIYYTENRHWSTVKCSTASHNTENHCKTDWERNEETQMGRDRRWDKKGSSHTCFQPSYKRKEKSLHTPAQLL